MSSEPQPGCPPDRSNPDWWDARYINGDVPWDSGTAPPEVVALVESGRVTPGWALDLGCGSGVTSRYLANRGYRVVGVDFSRVALERATAAAQAEGLPCLFARGDATDIRFVRVAATLAVDIGCFHSFTPEGRASYRYALAKRLQPGAYYLLYTFMVSVAPEPIADRASTPSHNTPTISYADIAAFAPQFVLRWTAHGEDRGRHSAWFLLQRV